MEGYFVYDGKGIYMGEFILSNSGLLGKGKLEYIEVEVEVEDFVFMFVLVIVSVDVFDLEEVCDGLVLVLEVYGEVVDLEW